MRKGFLHELFAFFQEAPGLHSDRRDPAGRQPRMQRLFTCAPPLVSTIILVVSISQQYNTISQQYYTISQK